MRKVVLLINLKHINSRIELIFIYSKYQFYFKCISKILQMKKVIIILFFFVGFICLTEAQSTEVSQKTFSRVSFKLNFSNVNSRQIVPAFSNQTVTLHETIYKKNAYYGLEGQYRFNNLLSAGLYFGFSNGTFISNEILNSDPIGYSFTIDRSGKSYFYGIKGELQLLPLLLKTDRIRLNVYCPVQLGLVSQRITTLNTNKINWDKSALEIGTGLGLGYNFTKNIGVFGEYMFGHFYNDRNSQWKVGLVLSF